jgi:hypothetical protein
VVSLCGRRVTDPHDDLSGNAKVAGNLRDRLAGGDLR